MNGKHEAKKLELPPIPLNSGTVQTVQCLSHFFMGDSWFIVGIYVVVVGPLFALYSPNSVTGVQWHLLLILINL